MAEARKRRRGFPVRIPVWATCRPQLERWCEMRISRGVLVAWLLGSASGWSQQPAPVQKVLHGKDETSLVAVKADPKKYVGTTFILCGGVKIGDYYNFTYMNAKDTHYCLDFSEAGEDYATPTHERIAFVSPEGNRG